MEWNWQEPPDAIEAIRSVRVFHTFDDDPTHWITSGPTTPPLIGLHSIGVSSRWPLPPDTNEARCLANPRRHGDSHQVPGVKCGCGLWGLTSLQVLAERLNVDIFELDALHRLYIAGYIVAEISQWGRIIPGSYGWRSAFARIERIVLPKPRERLPWEEVLYLPGLHRTGYKRPPGQLKRVETFVRNICHWVQDHELPVVLLDEGQDLDGLTPAIVEAPPEKRVRIYTDNGETAHILHLGYSNEAVVEFSLGEDHGGMQMYVELHHTHSAVRIQWRHLFGLIDPNKLQGKRNVTVLGYEINGTHAGFDSTIELFIGFDKYTPDDWDVLQIPARPNMGDKLGVQLWKGGREVYSV